jgi:hypothetical protein
MRKQPKSPEDPSPTTTKSGGTRKFGAYKGQLTVPDSFFEPLPEAELKAWEGNGHDGDPLKGAAPKSDA